MERLSDAFRGLDEAHRPVPAGRLEPLPPDGDIRRTIKAARQHRRILERQPHPAR